MATLQYERPTFVLQSGNPENVEFKVKPSTPKNRQKVYDLFMDSVEDLDEEADETQQGETILDTLKAFAEPVDGGLETLEPEELDQKEIEYYFNEAFI